MMARVRVERRADREDEEAEAEDDARNAERQRQHGIDQRAPLGRAAVDVIGLQHAHGDAERRPHHGEEQAVEDRLLGERIVEGDVFEVAQRQRRVGERAGPDRGERHHQQRDHGQHHAAADVHAFERERRGAAAGTQRDGAWPIALAGHGLEAPAVDVAALQHREQDRHRHHDDPERGGAAEVGWVLHQLEDLGRHGADAARRRECERHVEQPGAGDEHDERGREQRRQQQRNGDEAQGRPEARSVHPGGVFERRVHLAHRRNDEEIDVRRVEQRQHEGGAADAVDRDDVARQAEHVGQELAQYPAVGRRQIDPGDRPHIGRQEERHQIEDLEPAPARHVGARHHPGEAQPEHAAHERRPDPAYYGVAGGLIEPWIGEQAGEVLERQRRTVRIPVENAADDRCGEWPEDEGDADDDAGRRQGDLGQTATAATCRAVEACRLEARLCFRGSIHGKPHSRPVRGASIAMRGSAAPPRSIPRSTFDPCQRLGASAGLGFAR